VHAPNVDESDCTRDRFYEELDHVLDLFPKYYLKILLEDFNPKIWRENIVGPIRNESSHEILTLMGLE
jgi:hypothetical protein